LLTFSNSLISGVFPYTRYTAFAVYIIYIIFYADLQIYCLGNCHLLPATTHSTKRRLVRRYHLGDITHYWQSRPLLRRCTFVVRNHRCERRSPRLARTTTTTTTCCFRSRRRNDFVRNNRPWQRGRAASIHSNANHRDAPSSPWRNATTRPLGITGVTTQTKKRFRNPIQTFARRGNGRRKWQRNSRN